MPDQLQLRGGTTTEHNSFTGALREVTVDTTKKTVVVHDGASAGGTPLMKESGGNAASSVQLGSGGVNAFTIDSNQDITLTGASANVVWDKSDNALEFADNAVAAFGNGSDLTITHDATNTHIRNNTGTLNLRADSVRLTDAVIGHVYLAAATGGSTDLYYDNVKKFETTSYGVYSAGMGQFDDGIKIIDTQVARFGTGNDLQIYHDGTSSIIANTTGPLIIRDQSATRIHTDFFVVNNFANDENLILGYANGAVELYYDGSKKFETLTNGIKVHGNIFIDDNDEIRLGDSGDFQLFHNSSTGEARIFNSNAAGINIITDLFNVKNNANNETLLKATNGGAVELYYDGSKKLDTDASGINVTGDIDVTGKVAILDNQKLICGVGDDLQIYHDGSNSYVKNTNTNTNLILEGAHGVDIKHGGEQMARFKPDAAVELYHDNSKKFETTSSGVTVTGTVTETSDIALKSDIQPLTNTLEKIQQITGYKYNLISSISPSMGVIAQDVEKVFPELVHGSEGKKTLQYSGLIGVLVEAVKDLSAKVAALEAA